MRTTAVVLAGAFSMIAACSGKITDTSAGPGGDGGLNDAGPHGSCDADRPLSCTGGESTVGTDGGDGDPGAQVALTGRNFVAKTIYLGDVPRGSDSQSNIAWKSFGANIDGKVTDAASNDVCSPVSGGTRAAQGDGTDGIDNSFGENILPILLSVDGSNLASDMNASIAQGGTTFMLNLTGIIDDFAQTQTPLPGALLSGSFSDGVPTWTAADSWNVFKSSLVGGTLAGGAKANFGTGAISSGAWSSVSRSDVPFSLSLGGARMPLTIHHATVTFTHSSTNQLTLGNIAGVLSTTELVAALRHVAGQISDQLCNGSALDDLVAQIQAASDILQNGTNQAGVPCDGISIGLGFDATETAPPANAIDDVVVPDACGDSD